MATITVPTFLDGGTARTAGEAMTINGATASLTIRTDTRIHANAPTLMTGSLGTVTITEGDLIWDSSAIRWMPYNTGTGNAPAIGTTITQGGVSGYLLGVWASLTSAPTAVGSAMPADGFLKFREVSGGPFSAGALTGIGASATGPDVQGWIEIVMDQAANITIPRLGAHIARGGLFYLGETNGTLGQTFQCPTNGSASFSNGAFVETSPASGELEWWQGLGGTVPATQGWAHQHIGNPVGLTDRRQQFFKSLPTGILQIGEAYTQSGTYASLAAQASTYAEFSVSSSYTWISGKVEVYSATRHALSTGMQTGLDFTTGGATAYDGIYAVTVLDAYTFEVDLPGSGASGNVTSRSGLSVAFTAHLVNIGDFVYCNFTTGGGVAGIYEVFAVTSSSNYTVKAPRTTALTAGNVSVLHTLILTTVAVHDFAIGNTITVNFAGVEVDGVYPIYNVPSTTTLRINYAHPVAITSTAFTLSQTIGHVPEAGRKVYIPSNILRECTTAARAVNAAPNATLATRPEWVTVAAGAIDLEYVQGESGYMNFVQAYSVRMRYCSFADSIVISEVNAPLDIDHIGSGSWAAPDAAAALISYCVSGGTFDNSVIQRATVPSASDPCISIQSCNGITFNNVRAGSVQFNRQNYSDPWSIGGVTSNCTWSNCTGINGSFSALIFDCNVYNYNHCERYTGYTNPSLFTAILLAVASSGVTLDGLKSGWGVVPNTHCGTIIGIGLTQNVKVRNIGTPTEPFNCGTWAPNMVNTAYFVYNNNYFTDNIQISRCYFTNNFRLGLISQSNADSNVTVHDVRFGYFLSNNMSVPSGNIAAINSELRSVLMQYSPSGSASTYGSHFLSLFVGSKYGQYVIAFNETTPETASQFIQVSGIGKFNSSGGLILPSIGSQCIWDDPVFSLGHTGFRNVAPYMVGGTAAHYTLEFQCDVGAGFSGSWLTLTGINLSAITVDPSIGFRLKIRITTTTTNTNAITFLKIDTTTTLEAQNTCRYPLDIINLTINGIKPMSDVVIYAAGTTNILGSVDQKNATSWTYQYETPQNIDIGVFLPGYVPFYIRNYALGSTDASVPVSQTIDRNYTA